MQFLHCRLQSLAAVTSWQLMDVLELTFLFLFLFLFAYNC